MVTTVLVGIAGPGLLLKPGGGLYWMIPAVPASLADGYHAWPSLLEMVVAPPRPSGYTSVDSAT
jgi:hypothetical protein